MTASAAAPAKIKGTSITTPTETGDNHTLVLGQLKEVAEIGQRLRGDPKDSFVRVGELMNATGARLVNNTVQPPNSTAASAGTVTVAGSISGDGSSGSPLQLVGDSASPGNNMVYGTNGSGVKSWYAAGGGSYTPPVNTKGDLFGFTTVPARIAIGTNGLVLTADSTAAPGVSWQAGGGGSPFNVTPDTHSTGVPAFVANDEFEGASLDTAGTRFTGALPWTAFNMTGSSSATLNNGSLVGVTDGTSGSLHSIIQAASGSAWRYRAKFNAGYTTTASSAGFAARESSSGKSFLIGLLINTGASPNVWLSYFTNDTTFNSFTGLVAYASAYDTFLNWFVEDLWHEIELQSGTLFYRISRTGVDGTFIQVGSVGLVAAGISALDGIGLGWFGGASSELILCCDWFRRKA